MAYTVTSKYKHADLPVILHNEKRGLLTFDNGTLDVLQLSKDGRREIYLQIIPYVPSLMMNQLLNDYYHALLETSYSPN